MTMTQQELPSCLHPPESVDVVAYENGLHVFCRLCRKDLRWVVRGEGDGQPGS